MPTVSASPRPGPRRRTPRLARAYALALVLSAASSATTATANAAPELVTNSYLLAGRQNELALAGSAALVGTQAGRGADAVRSFTPGQAPRMIARATADPSAAELGSIQFAASASRIVLLNDSYTTGYKGSGGTSYQDLLAGPLGAPLATLTSQCALAPSLDETVGDEGGSFASHSAIAVDGEVVAYDSYGCLVIHDFASGLQRVVPLAATLDPVVKGELWRLPQGDLLSVAGRLLAYRANPPGGEGPASVVVYDIETGSVLYTVPLRPEGPESQAPSFALQADGTLVIAYPSSCAATVSTAAAPTPRPLGVPACYVDRLLGGRALLVAPGAGNERLLEWSSLEAPAAHPIAALGVDGILEAVPPEMDESTVLYALNGCYPRIYRAPLAEPGTPPPLPRSCPLHVSPRATLTVKSLSVTLRCPLGCLGRFTAWVRTAQELHTGHGGQQVGSEPHTEAVSTDYSLPPYRAETFTLLPTREYEEHPSARALVRQLRRHRRLWLALFFTTYTPDAGRLYEEEAREMGITLTTSSQVSVPIAAANA